MARNERRIVGFTVAILILALAVGLLGWGNRHDASERRRLQADVASNRARVGQLEGQLRDNGIEPAAPTTTTTTAVRRSPPRSSSTTAVHAPATTRALVTTTTSTTRPSAPQPTTTTTSPPSTTSTTACATQLLGRCVP